MKALDAMSRRLRRKFVFASMLAVTVVLAALIAVINTVNYVNVCHRAEDRLDLIVKNGGTLLTGDDRETTLDEKDNKISQGVAADLEEQHGGKDRTSDQQSHAPRVLNDPAKTMSAEAPFETRFFTVMLSSKGAVLESDTDYVAAVSESDAERYARRLYRRGATSGFLGMYRYRAVSEDGGGETVYIFLDCSRDLSNFQSFLGVSLAVAAAAWLGVLGLVIVFSRFVVRPIAVSYARQKQFITDASHELKTPLSVIDAANAVQEIESGESEWTQSIHDQVKRLTALTEHLVFLARMDEGAASFSSDDVDLSELVSTAAEPFATVATSRGGKHLELDIEPEIHIKGDAAGLSQVVELLLDNATRYASEGGDIAIALHSGMRGAGKAGVELTVANDVDKLPEGDLDRLFDRFYRADASRNSQTGGSGVGLSVVRAIAEAHGGKASVSGEGARITFTVRL